MNRSSPNRLDAAHWLALWEQCGRLPPSLQSCALLAPLLDGDAAGAPDGADGDAGGDAGGDAARHPEHWPLGRRDAALLDLHAALFGHALKPATRCPACGEQIDLSLSTDQLRVDPVPAVERGSVSAGGWLVEWRLPTSVDLAAVAAASAGNERAAQQALLQRCVQRATCNGAVVNSAALATALPAALVQQVAADMAAADPQALTELALQCPACPHAWTEVFDIGAFLMQRLAHWAEVTLDQVHTLARAYGWTEADTLKLSPTRRAHYLARVLA